MLAEILKNHWLFTVLDKTQLDHITQRFSTKTYTRGQYVFHQSDLPDNLYVILNGEVSIETHSREGKVVKITHLSNGDIFGELALIEMDLEVQGRS